MKEAGKVLFLGDIEDFFLNCSDALFEFEQLHQKPSIAYREQKVFSAKEQGLSLWNAPKYHVDNIEIDTHTPCVAKAKLMRTSYDKIAYKESLAGQSNDLRTMHVPRCLFVAGFFETNDGKFIFGVRGGQHINRKKGSVTWIGGMVEPIEHVQCLNADDLKNQLMEELHEELGYIGSVTSCSCIGIVESWKRNIGIIYHVTLPVSSDEMKLFFDVHSDEELSSILMMPQDELLSFLDSLDNVREQRSVFAEYILSKKKKL